MLFARRQVWLPTLWGWLVLLAAAAIVLFGLGRAAYPLLAVTEPARGDGSGARTLVVEGWLDPPEIAQAVAVFKRGRYERVLTTGGPIDAWFDPGGWKTFAARGAHYLTTYGLAGVPIIQAPAPETLQDRTYVTALMVRDWAHASGTKLGAIDVVSAGAHARRSRLAYRMALGDAVEVGIFAVTPKHFDAERWWTSSVGAKAMLDEVLSLGWTVCCFWPAPPPGDAL